MREPTTGSFYSDDEDSIDGFVPNEDVHVIPSHEQENSSFESIFF